MSLLPVAGQRALFLGRDGLIKVNSTENFNFVDSIFYLVRTACKASYCMVAVTNQMGIGKYRKNEDTKPGPGIAAGVWTNVLFSDDTFVALEGLDYLPVQALRDPIARLEGAVTA